MTEPKTIGATLDQLSHFFHRADRVERHQPFGAGHADGDGEGGRVRKAPSGYLGSIPSSAFFLSSLVFSKGFLQRPEALMAGKLCNLS